MAAFDLEPPPFEESESIKPTEDESVAVGVTLSPQSELRDFAISSGDEVNNSSQSPKISETFSYSNSDLNKDSLSFDGSTNKEPHLLSENFTQKNIHMHYQIASPPGAEPTESESGWADFAVFTSPQMGPSTVQVERDEITIPETYGKQHDKDKPNGDFTAINSFDVGTHTTTGFSPCYSTEAIADSNFSSNINSDPSSECVKSFEKELSTQRQNCGFELDENCATCSPVVPDASSSNTPPLGDSPPDQPHPEHSNLADVQLDHSSHESVSVQREHAIGSSNASPAMATEEDDFGGFEAATLPARDMIETPAATDELKPIGRRLSGDFESPAPPLSAPSSNSFSAVVRSAPTCSLPEVSPPVEPTPTRPDAGGHAVDARLQLLFERFFPFMQSPSRPQEKYLLLTFTNFSLILNIVRACVIMHTCTVSHGYGLYGYCNYCTVAPIFALFIRPLVCFVCNLNH